MPALNVSDISFSVGTFPRGGCACQDRARSAPCHEENVAPDSVAQRFREPRGCERSTSLLDESVHPFAVLGQVAGLREGLAAGGAYIGALAGMGAHVCLQAAGLREGMTAGGAGVGADAGMGSHVCRQVAGLREGMAAGGAGVGADAGMGSHVCRQVAGLREGMAAGGAGVGAVAGMGAHVCRQATGLREGLPADRALKDEFGPHPAPPPLARPSRASTRSFSRVLVAPPLSSDHRVARHEFAPFQTAG